MILVIGEFGESHVPFFGLFDTKTVMFTVLVLGKSEIVSAMNEIDNAVIV